MGRRTATIIATVALAAASTLAGCGGDGDGGSKRVDGKSDAAPPVQLEGEVEIEGTDDLTSSGAHAQLTMTLEDNAFSPTFVKAAPGATVDVAISNHGDRTHTFTIDGLGVDVEVEPGGTGAASVVLPTEGVVRFACRYHGQGGMQGAFYFTAGETASGSTGGYPSVPSDY